MSATSEYIYDPYEIKNPTKRVVLVRHGESTWNDLNLFTGWKDVPLSKKGE